MTNHHLYLITGGLGSGKSTLIDLLNEHGFRTVPEAARVILKKQNKAGQKNIQFSDRLAFCDLLLKQSIADYLLVKNTESAIFFDRGLPDLRGYESIAQGEKWHIMLNKVKEAINTYRYNRQAFILPPWEAIYIQDEERTHSFEQAQHAYHLLKNAYEASGYELYELPHASPEHRLEKIKEITGEKS